MPPPYCYEYPRPAVTVDIVVFAIRGEELAVLMIRRKGEPFAGRWALPGGFVNIDEAAEDAARRELREETGLDLGGRIAPIGFFDRPGRDPRGRTISLAFAATIPGIPEIRGGDDAAEAAWLGFHGLRDLAFDHDQIVREAHDWLVASLGDAWVALGLLPQVFDGDDVRRVFRAVEGSVRGAHFWLSRQVRAGVLVTSEVGPPRTYRARELHAGP